MMNPIEPVKNLLHNAWVQGGVAGVLLVSLLGSGAYALYTFVPVWRDATIAESKARIDHTRAASESINQIALTLAALRVEINNHNEEIGSKLSLALGRRR